MTRLVPVEGAIVMPEGVTHAEAVWRYRTEVAGGLQVAGGAIPCQIIETGEVRGMDSKALKVMVHDVGDIVAAHPWATLEVRFKGLSAGFEKHIPLVLTREETTLRIDKSMTNSRLVELTRDHAVFLNWRFDRDGYILVDGVNDTIVALAPKDKVFQHQHGIEDITNLKAQLWGKASVERVERLERDKADLVNGKIPTSQLPGAALNSIFFVHSEAEMLALKVEAGDIAVRTDKGNLRFEFVGDDPTKLEQWSPQFPSGADGEAATGVTSINNQRGDVVLSAADVGAAPVRHKHTAADISDWASAVDRRARYNVAGGAGITTAWDANNSRQTILLDAAARVVKDGVMQSLKAGTGISLVQDSVSGEVTVAVSGSGGWVDWNDVRNAPAAFVPTQHAASHASWGSDPITPAMIGAAEAGHGHTLRQLGAAAKEHTHTTKEITDYAATTDARAFEVLANSLALGPGLHKTVNQQGRQVLVEVDTAAGVTFEEADGAPSIMASRVIVPNGALTQVSDGVVRLNVGKGGTGTAGPNIATGGPEMSYSPKYVRTAEIINPLPFRSDIIGRATIRTAFAQSDGSDIRVFSEAGIQRPSAVVTAIPGPNYIDYELLWAETMDASQKRVYEVRYGDEYAPERPYHQDTLSRLLNTGSSKKFGKLRVDADTRQRYATPDLGAEGIWDLARMPETQTLPEPLPWLDTQVHSILWDFRNGRERGGNYPDESYYYDAYINYVWIPGIIFQDAEGRMVGGFAIPFNYGDYAEPFKASYAPQPRGYYSGGMGIRCRQLSDGYSWDIAETRWNEERANIVNLRYRVGYGWVLNVVEARGDTNFLNTAENFAGVYTSATEYIAFKSLGMPLEVRNTRYEDPTTWVTRNFGLERTAKATVGEEEEYVPPEVTTP